MDSVVFPQLPTYVGAPTLAGLLSLAITILLPILAALLMRASWTAFRKGLVLLAFSAIKAVLEAWLAATDAHTHFNWVTTLYSVLVQFVLAVVAYVGLLKQTSVQQAALRGGPVKDRTSNGRVVD